MWRFWVRGLWGMGLAELAALASWDVVLCDISGEVIEKALKGIQESLAMMGRGERAAEVMGRIRCVTSIDEAGSVNGYCYRVLA